MIAAAFHIEAGRMVYAVGQRIETDEWREMFGCRGIWAREADPRWFIFTTAPQSELPAEAWLRRNGVAECWFPTEARWKRLPHGKNRKVQYLAPIVPRYLFAKLDMEPHWDVLFDRARGKLTGVVSRDGTPLPIPEDAMMRMRQVPATLYAIREKRKIAATIRAGDRAEIVSGPLAGWTVDVSRINAGIASIVIPMLGADAVSVSVDSLRKVV